jgi:hypothetical protein
MSLAAIKRRLQLGSKIQMVRHDWGPGGKPHEKVAAVRTVKIVRTTGVMFEGGSWLYWPKADEVLETKEGFWISLRDDFKQRIEYEWRDNAS